MNKEFIASLVKVQQGLKAPKGQYNSFAKYHYRSCEDILQAVKPLLEEHSLYIYITDEIEHSNGKTYIKATASITNGENTISTSALAREPETKKGMDDSQITGAASSYARKYALNGLFGIDDTEDADGKDNRKNGDGRENKSPKGNSFNIEDVYKEIQSAKDVEQVKGIYRKHIDEAKISGNEQNLINACSARKDDILDKQTALAS